MVPDSPVFNAPFSYSGQAMTNDASACNTTIMTTDANDTGLSASCSPPALSMPTTILLPYTSIGPAMCHNVGKLPIPHCSPQYQVFTVEPDNLLAVPASLRPTVLQGEIPHIQYVDALPFEGLRDKLLIGLHTGSFDEIEFCTDLLNDGFRIWGNDPTLPMAWEVTEPFARKWRWLLDDCIIDIANFWSGQSRIPAIQG
ncbi:hypothetical protein V1514DRAFT_330107 [Lipomyces japonicus]|uniref:uncharacterized protein n=1 Tax=Lipomyces japonicus TaxID=56871 RepID=UPI0034CE7A0C